MMNQRFTPPAPTIADHELLDNDEFIVIVDDFADIVGLLQEFLEQEGFQVVVAGSAEALRQQLTQHTVALALLDIGLPDADGINLLPELKQQYPDLSVIMLTAVTDLQTALLCLRYGADDYLAKPVHFTDLLATLRRVLEKRRLIIRNRQYQRQIEQATFRIRLAHKLAMKMNTTYLSMIELDGMLQAILVGITAAEGLQFNRAFLALFDATETTLKGRLAIGPGQRQAGDAVSADKGDLGVALPDQQQNQADSETDGDAEVNRIVRALAIDAADTDHILIRAVQNRQSINVVNGQCEVPVSLELLGLLQEDTFVVVPLYSPSRALGVIIADHFVDRSPIDAERVQALESFASQASLAIEHCHLYMDMQHKIKELEAVTSELEKNKDLLVETERYSAIGHMASQLAHNIRNPITAIGGTARLLARKIDNKEWLQFLGMMASEAEKIEKILEDLFAFVDQVKPVCVQTPLLPLIRKALLLLFGSLQDKNIRQAMQFPEVDPIVDVDPRLLQQALVHLIRNSVEAMPGGGELSIAVQSEETLVRISIRDTGQGLGEVNLEHATDPFFTTKIIGTGMGLTLVKRIVEDHGGSLNLRNRSEGMGGMEAVIVLPRVGAM